MDIRFIGKVHSPLKILKECPLQENENAPGAIIEVYPDFSEAAKDIRPGNNLILFTWLDKADRTILTTHPRNDPDTPMTGIFSTRSPDRPNPIGIHFVKVISALSDSKFHVSALEVLDQTLVIDIKPDLREIN